MMLTHGSRGGFNSKMVSYAGGALDSVDGVGNPSAQATLAETIGKISVGE